MLKLLHLLGICNGFAGFGLEVCRQIRRLQKYFQGTKTIKECLLFWSKIIQSSKQRIDKKKYWWWLVKSCLPVCLFSTLLERHMYKVLMVETYCFANKYIARGESFISWKILKPIFMLCGFIKQGATTDSMHMVSNPFIFWWLMWGALRNKP